MHTKVSTTLPTLPPELYPTIVRFSHPEAGHNLRCLNRNLSDVITQDDLVWGEFGWRWYHQCRKRCWVWAAKHGHVKVVEWLMEEDEHHHRWWQAGVAAVKFGRTEVVKQLMGVHDAEERGRSAYIWYYGITNNMDTQEEERLPDEEIFDPEILPEWTGYLSARVWIDQDWGFWGGALQDFEVWTEAFLRWEGQLEFLFFVAARNGQVDMMKLFLQMGLERQRVLDMDDIHMPAAVHSGCLEAVKFLVDNGGNIHLLFYEAARQGQLEMFEYCLPKWLEHTDSNVLFEDAEDAKDAFLGAALGGHEKVVGLFLDRGIVHGNRGETEEVLINLALIEAAKKGHHATVQLLLNRGADDGRDEIVEVLSA